MCKLYYDDTDLELSWNRFKSTFTTISDKHAPMRTFKIKGNSVPWIDEDIVNLMRERDKLHKKALSLKCHDTMLVYRKYRNIVTKKIRLAKKAYLIDHLAVQPGADQKDIWKSIKFG